MNANHKVVIVGGGFTGLVAAYDLAKAGRKVTLLESERFLGGLAGTFEISSGYRVEKFYHHWFSSDRAILDFIKEIGLKENIEFRPTNTGLFHANSVFRLKSPLDLLKFTPLPFFSRLRTGFMALAARRISDWKKLENESASDWIRRYAGEKSYEIIWKPLLIGKFGDEAENISAVWFWNKLKLRGGSRDESGKETLAYLRGGFSILIDKMESELRRLGVEIRVATKVTEIKVEDGKVQGVMVGAELIEAQAVLATIPLPVFKEITPELSKSYKHQISKIRFLGNICLILRLKRSLSSTYWLNIADPSFPYVGIIEHTNFDPPERYGGEHIVYLSRYLPTSHELYQKSDEEVFNYSLPFIQKMFPEFSKDWVIGHAVWRAEYSQPIVTKHYSKLIPDARTPVDGLWLSTMAQIYPEDRGTNYAIEYGRKVAAEMLASEKGNSKRN
jgi:protoporphyrinogen oxidase